MKKEVKDTIITELGEKLKQYPHFYLVDVTGLNAEDTSNLRRKCFKSEIKMVVVKNTLLHKAFEASEVDSLFCTYWQYGCPFLGSCQHASQAAEGLHEAGYPCIEGCLRRGEHLRRC